MQDFRKLVVWRKAHELTTGLYLLTASFPREEVYGLTSQIRRAASSVPANIAEGCGRGGNAELARFLRIAMGSASELEYHLLLARNLHYLAEKDYLVEKDYEVTADKVIEIKRMLAGLVRRLRVGPLLTTED
jgi:four helix bundle protein